MPLIEFSGRPLRLAIEAIDLGALQLRRNAAPRSATPCRAAPRSTAQRSAAQRCAALCAASHCAAPRRAAPCRRHAAPPMRSAAPCNALLRSWGSRPNDRHLGTTSTSVNWTVGTQVLSASLCRISNVEPALVSIPQHDVCTPLLTIVGT